MRKIDCKKCKQSVKRGGALSLLNKDNASNLTLNIRHNTEENGIFNTSLFCVF